MATVDLKPVNRYLFVLNSLTGSTYGPLMSSDKYSRPYILAEIRYLSPEGRFGRRG